MEVAETNSGTGVSKSSTSMEERSQEVSVEKTATGSIEQAVSSQRKVEQSVAKSVQQDSSSVVQKSVVQKSSVSDDKPSSETSPPTTNGEENVATKTDASNSKEEVKLEDIGENDEEEDEEVEEIVEEVEEGDSDGEVVEIVETVVVKKESPKPKVVEVKQEEGEEEEASAAVTISLKKPVKVSQEEEEEEVKVEVKIQQQEKPTPKVEKVTEVEETTQVTVETKQQAPPSEITEPVVQETPKETLTQEQNTTQKLQSSPQTKTLVEETVKTVTETTSTQVTQKLEPPQISEEKIFQQDIKREPEPPKRTDEQGQQQELPPEKASEPPQTLQREPPIVKQQQQEQLPKQQSYQQPTQYQPERDVPSYEHKPYYQQQHQQQFPQQQSEIKQENIKNTLKEIISDIDRVIEQEEETSHITSKSTTKEASNDASGYSSTSAVYERSDFQDLDGFTTIHKQTTRTVKTTPPTAPNINSYISKGHRSMSLPTPHEIQHEDTATKNVDLQKIFTPATDASEILPKNRKLYASSAFYSPTLHPTVEDQVELARRISHSLSDISNQQSKGQSMYVNRKKRSVKWEHEGEGRAEIQEYNGYSQETKENGYHTKSSSSSIHHDKVPLKLVMNPRGQLRDFSSVRQEDFNTEAGLLSPDKCAELVTALNAPKGKGAELFAKRRKKAENWIVDECASTLSPGGGIYSHKPTSPILPAYSDVGVQRVQLNMHQDQVQDKYAQPRLKLIKTPWDAALETGSASSAFQEFSNQKSSTTYDYGGQHMSSSMPTYYQSDSTPKYEQKAYPKPSYQPSSQRDLAYKPSVPQGWNAPPPSLPTALYTPPQIPLDSYIPPPAEKLLPPSTSGGYNSPSIYVQPAPSSFPTYQPPSQSAPSSFPTYQPSSPQTYQQSFPVAKPSSNYTSSAHLHARPTTTWVPQQSKVANTASTAFNPSPLSYDKLAKFEQPSEDDYGSYSQPIPRSQPLTVPTSKVRNTSPIPFSSSSLPSKAAPQSFPIQQSYQPQTDFRTIPSQQQSSGNYYAPSEDSFSYGSHVPSSRVSSVDLSQFQNHNTAARGWNQMQDYYRPITFTKPRVELPFTDF